MAKGGRRTTSGSATTTREGRGGGSGRQGGVVAARPVPELPVWVAPVVYAAVTVLLFREFFLGGVSMLGFDSLALSYFARNFYTEFVQQFHRMPHWNPLLMGGLPFVEGMHGDIFYPPSLALFFMDARAMWGWKMSLHIFLAGMFTYLWLRRGLLLSRAAAFFGGLVFMMGTNMISLVLPGGDGKLFVSALAPLMFWLTERAARLNRPQDYAIFALGLALTLFTSHMQAAYYLVWGVSLYFLFRAWQLGRLEAAGVARAFGLRVATFALAGVLGVGAAAVQFLPPLAYLQEFSHRADRQESHETGKAWSATYAMNAEEIVALAVPEFVGELTPSSPEQAPAGYWGKNPMKLNNEYAGLVPLLLLPILLLRRRTAQVWFFTGLGVLTLLYAVADSTPLFHLFYLIPGVSLFRAWSMIIFLYGLALATLGALAVQQLLEWLADVRAGEERASARRILWIAAAVLGGLALAQSAGVVTGMWGSIFAESIQFDRLQANGPYITMGFWIAALIAAAVAGVWELAARDVLTPAMLVVLLALVAGIDLYRAGRPFITYTALVNRFQDGAPQFRADDSILYLQQRQAQGEPFRVFDLSNLLGAQGAYGHNDLAVHGLEQLAGHHGNEMGRYRALIGGEAAINLGASELRLADVTNTVYLLAPGRLEHPKLEEVHAGMQSVIYRNRDALPRAYVVGNVEQYATEDDVMTRMLDARFEARTTALVAEPLPAGVQVAAGAAGTVLWQNREVDRHVLQVEADRPALLMILDNWYPAWAAEVNGQPAPIIRANYTFRAVPVPAGQSTVTLRYTPAALRTGAIISLAVLLLLLGVVAAGAVGERRRGTAITVGEAGTPGPG
ncbi:MAG TPA: YfhO family protein [Longimicrobiales bacterium]|nr:YfhO family protein [Longimicrobiales bacterium]